MWFQQRCRRISWCSLFNVFICLWPSCHSNWFPFLDRQLNAFCPNLSVSSSAKQSFSRSVSSNDFSRWRDPKTVVPSNMRKNIFRKIKRIWVGNTSSTVYVNILKDNSRLCQVIAVISGPRTIICKKHLGLKHWLSLLWALLSVQKGLLITPVPSASPHFFRLAKSLWNFLLESNQNYQQKRSVGNFPSSLWM